MAWLRAFEVAGWLVDDVDWRAGEIVVRGTHWSGDGEDDAGVAGEETSWLGA
jgi:hypothetical protein